MQKIFKTISLEPLRNREYPKLRKGINTEGNVDERGCPIVPFSVEVAELLSTNPKYGQIDKSFIVFPILFLQTFDVIGLMSDQEFVEAFNLINEDFDPYTRKTALPVQNYYDTEQYQISGFTDSLLDRVRTYNINTPYIVNFNLHESPSLGFTGVLEIKPNSIVYVIGGDISNVGQYVPNTGIVYETFSDLRDVVDVVTGEIKKIPLTTFTYTAKGTQSYNVSLSASFHEEKYLGIVEIPRVESDILIDRGNVNGMEKFLKMSEIDSVEQLAKYGLNMFNVVKLG